jgi:hypothetical protein
VELSVNGKNVTEALDWADAIQRHNMMDPMEVVVTREPPNKIHKEEKAMLHGLTVPLCTVFRVQFVTSSIG